MGKAESWDAWEKKRHENVKQQQHIVRQQQHIVKQQQQIVKLQHNVVELLQQLECGKEEEAGLRHAHNALLGYGCDLGMPCYMGAACRRPSCSAKHDS